MSVLRCNRTTSADGGGGKIVTDRSFVSSGIDGAPLNADVASASYTESVIGDAADETYKVNDLVEVTIAPAVTPPAE
jgi:hypothetical protein